MALTIRQICIERLQAEIDSGSTDATLYKDFISKLTTNTDDEIELNFRRNFDLLQAVRLTASQLGAPPQLALEEPLDVVQDLTPQDPSLIS